jgi:hypothetical protein
VVLINGESMTDINATAVITLKEFQDQLLKTNIQIRFARVKSQVMDVMKRGAWKRPFHRSIIIPACKRPWMPSSPSYKDPSPMGDPTPPGDPTLLDALEFHQCCGNKKSCA